MKYTTALTLPLAGLSVAQYTSTSKVPWITQVQTGFSSGCMDALGLGLSMNEDALVFDMKQFHADMNGSKKNPRISDYGVCVMQLNFKFQAGWRFRFTNATYSGNAKASGGAYIPSLLTTTYLQYMRTNWTAQGDLIDRQFRAAELADYRVTTDFGKAGTYDSSFEATTTFDQAGSTWTPCVPELYDANQEFKLMMQTHAGFSYGDQAPYPGEASIGSPTTGLKVKLGLQWEQCDPAKLPVDSWGTKRGSRGEWLPPSNTTTGPGYPAQ